MASQPPALSRSDRPASFERRRAQRDEVQQAVRDAMPQLLGDTPFKDLTVDEIAAAAGLSRTAFYFYFRDKYDLLIAAAEELAETFYREAERWWHGEGDPEDLVRAALEGVAAVYEQNAGLIRVVTEVSTYDEDFGNFWRSLVQRFIDATSEHLRREHETGRVAAADPLGSAESLVWMAERCLYVYVAIEGRPARDVVESLAQLWFGALYRQSE